MVGWGVTHAVPVSADVIEVGADGPVVVSGGTAPVITVGATRDGGNGDVADSFIGVEPVPDVPAPAMTIMRAPVAPVDFQPSLLRAARRYDVSPALLAALVWQESRWQPGALSAKGAIGLAQLMPATARALAVDPRDAGANLEGAAHYLRQLLDLFDGDVERALAAYNAGPARVLKAGGVPPFAETRLYVSRIMDRLSVVDPIVSSGATP